MPEKEIPSDQPAPDSRQASEQIPYSGIRNNEFPVVPSGESSLPETVEGDVVDVNHDRTAALVPAETPDIADGSAPTERRGPASTMPIGKRIGIAAVAVGAGSALVVGVLFASQAGSDTPSHAQKSSNEASQSPQPLATKAATKTPNFAELIAAQEIKSGQTPDALASDIIDRINNWGMSGTDTFQDDYKAEVAKTGDASDASRNKFEDDYAMSQYVNIFGPALFGIKPGDIVEPQLQDRISGFISGNSSNLELHWFTSADATPYERSRNIDPDVPVRVGSQSGDLTTLFINYTEVDNAVLNKISGLYAKQGEIGPDGTKETFVVTVRNSGAVEKITSALVNFR